MPNLSEHVWLLLLAVGGFGIAAILRIAAMSVRTATAMHDLKMQVSDLRRQRLEQANHEEAPSVGPAPGAGGAAEAVAAPAR